MRSEAVKLSTSTGKSNAGLGRIRIFIAHSSEDLEKTEKIAKALRARGFEVWLDKWSIKVGQSIVEKISEGLTVGDFCVVVLSKNSVTSRWVSKEISMALFLELSEKSIFILPVRIDDCEIPISLHDKKYANFRKSFEEGMDELLDAIQSPVAVQDETPKPRMTSHEEMVSLVDALSKLPEEAVREKMRDLSILEKRRIIAEVMDRFALASVEESSGLRSLSLLYVLDYAAREGARPSGILFETLFKEYAYRSLPFFKTDVLRLLGKHVGSPEVREWVIEQKLVDWFVEEFEKSSSWAIGGVNSEIVANLAPILTKSELQRIATAALTNDQIYLSYGAIEPLRRLFTLHDKWLTDEQRDQLRKRKLR